MAVRVWRTVLMLLVAASTFTTGTVAVSSVMPLSTSGLAVAVKAVPLGTMMLLALPSLSFHSAQ